MLEFVLMLINVHCPLKKKKKITTMVMADQSGAGGTRKSGEAQETTLEPREHGAKVDQIGQRADRVQGLEPRGGAKG